jgi:4-oxalocrotonate tautomerase
VPRQPARREKLQASDEVRGDIEPMPVVTIQMWEGRTAEQKRRLARAVTDAMVEHAGAKPDALHVIIQEYPLENWALAGTLGIDRDDA